MYVVISDYKNSGQTKLSQLLNSDISEHECFRVIDTKDGVVESISKQMLVQCINNGMKFCDSVVKDYNFAVWFTSNMLKARVLNLDMNSDVNFKCRVIDKLNRYNSLMGKKQAKNLRFYYVRFGVISNVANEFYIVFFNDEEEIFYAVTKDGVFNCPLRGSSEYYIGSVGGEVVSSSEEDEKFISIRVLDKLLAGVGYILYFSRYGKYITKRKDFYSTSVRKVKNRVTEGKKELCVI